MDYISARLKQKMNNHQDPTRKSKMKTVPKERCRWHEKKEETPSLKELVGSDVVHDLAERNSSFLRCPSLFWVDVVPFD